MEKEEFEKTFWNIEHEKGKVIVKLENAKITAWSYVITEHLVSFYAKTGNECITVSIASIVFLF